jgi:pimeloyl-ACP methyl ester carboxylesterase
VPGNTQYDPADVSRPDAPPVVLPPGAHLRRVRVGDFETVAIEAGPRDSREAAVFMHGNPGNSLDFLGILRSVPPGTRLIAFDILGYGKADKPWDFPYTLEAGRPLVDRALDSLGIDRVHLVGHDVGSVVAVDWAARHPRNLASAVMLAGGILIGYQDHHFARAWKTDRVGEQTMRDTDREGYVSMVQLHSPRPLPREFLDRNYDAFDRATRCAILKLYRGMPDLNALGREHAEALRPYDRPALVIWGDRDVFLPPTIAASNREGFPSADIHVFSNSGHWPFVDEEERTVELMSAFFRRHVVEQAGARIKLAVTPRHALVGRRTRFRFRAHLGPSGRPVAGVVVRLAGRSARTDARGRAALGVTARRAALVKVSAAKATLAAGRKSVRFLARTRR